MEELNSLNTLWIAIILTLLPMYVFFLCHLEILQYQMVPHNSTPFDTIYLEIMPDLTD